jgi:hypothetical protein
LYESKSLKDLFISSTGGKIGFGFNTSVMVVIVYAFSFGESIATMLRQFDIVAVR